MTDASKPLAGVRIALTRERNQIANIRSALEQLGAIVLATPLIKLAATTDWAETDRYLDQIGQYLWIVFTSGHAVEFFVERARSRNIALNRNKIACVGPGTARAAKAAGLNVDFQPTTQNGQGMSQELRMAGLKRGSKVLAPRGNISLRGLVESLQTAGVVVDAPVVYVNAPDAEGAAELAKALSSGGVDVIAFASPSAFESALAMLDETGKIALGKTRLYSIGPASSEVIKKAGYTVKEEARPHDMQGMIAAITRGETGRG